MITKITFWCQKVLPLVFDDSLSYYEQLCKVVDKLNEVINDTNKAFNQLETDVNAELNTKQDTLVSGTNIKTVNGESILGSGNIEAGGTDVEGNPTGDVTDGDLTKIKIGSKVYSIHNYTDAINAKQDTLVSGNNIKTVNGESILGSGNIDAGGTDVEGNPTGGVTDGDLTKIKIGTKVYTIHDYTSELNGKLDKMTNSGARGLYSVSGTKQELIYPSNSAAANSIPVRDGNGSVRFGTPVENNDNKQYAATIENVLKKQDKLVSGENIKTVNGQTILGSGNIEAGGTDVEGNPTGNATDGDLTKIKIGSKIYSIHDYTDAINGKLDKVTGTSGYPQAYVKNTDGNQTMFGITPVASSNTIIYRDGNGHANITTPTQNNHIANKRYVDNAISGKQDTLVSGTNIKTVNGQCILGSGNIEAGGTDVEGNPTGNATDGDLTKIKIGSKIYSIHDYTDAINGKLDKVTGTSGYPQAYVKNTDGNQTMFGITPVASSNTIIYRDGNGHANITTPTQNNHIANKRYVDNAISGKQDTLVSGTNIKTVNGQCILGSGNITIQGGGVPTQTVTNNYNVGGTSTLSSTAIFTRCGNMVNVRLIITYTWDGDAQSWSKVVVVNIPEGYRAFQAASVKATTTGLKLGTNCLAQIQIPDNGGFFVNGDVAVSNTGKLTVSCSNVSDQYDDFAIFDLTYFGEVTEI